MLEEVVFTWKLIKQFQLRANAPGHLPNAKPRILLTNRGHKEAQKAQNELLKNFVPLVPLGG